MSQLIACATPEGVMIASDSRAETFTTSGEEQFVQVDRFIPLTSHAVLASAGALEAQDLAREFADFVKDEGLKDIDAIIQAAVPFFTGKVDEFLRKACEKLPLNPVINMYMLLAGCSPEKSDQPGRLFIIWDRVQPPKIEFTEGTHIFTLPRRMGLEYKLNQLVASLASLADMVDLAKSAMEKLASQDQYVGPPFRYFAISQAGIAET
jgi:hypothetical protein